MKRSCTVTNSLNEPRTYSYLNDPSSCLLYIREDVDDPVVPYEPQLQGSNVVVQIRIIFAEFVVIYEL